MTLLHETIRISLELTGKRLQQADDLSQGHFQGKTRSEQAFETQRIELARGLYLFPDEVRKWPRNTYSYRLPSIPRWADRLGHYNDIQGHGRNTYSKTTQHSRLTDSAITTTSKGGPRRTVTTRLQSLV